MMKLLRAACHRYFKSRLFFICAGLSLILGLWLGIYLYQEPHFAENHMWIAILELALIAIFVSLSVGTEHTHGGFQRKVVLGATKERIFLSELLVVIASVSLLFLLCAVPVVAINSRLIPNFHLEILFWFVFGMWLCSVSFAVTILTFAMLIPSRTIAAVVALLFLFGMLIWNDTVTSRLMQPEQWESMRYDEATDSFVTMLHENENYIHPPLRTFLAAVDNCLPNTQFMFCTDALHSCFYSDEAWAQIWEGLPDQPPERRDAVAPEAARTIREFPLYSSAWIVLIVTVGLVLFRRKNLK